MAQFYPFFIIIFAGVFFSMVFRRMHVPWVVGLILGGILIGPQFLDILTIDPIVEFMGEIGLICLMFMAGLETKLSNFKNFKSGLVWLSFINGAIPFIVGMGIAYMFGYGLTSSLLVGIIFISSSIAVVIPSLETYKLLNTKLGQSVIITTVIQDIASLVLLSFVLQKIDPVTTLPLYIFYPLVVGILFLLKYIIPKIENFFIKNTSNEEELFQQGFRSTFFILLGTVIAFELLGLHPIIAGFFAGLMLSSSVKSPKLKDKIRTISYGIFIPTFFIIIGAKTNITLLLQSKSTLLLVSVIVAGSIFSKFISGFIGAKMVGFNSTESLLFSTSSIPQLSTTLAVAFASFSFGFVDEKLIVAMVALSIITTIVSPVLMNILGKRIKEEAH